MRVLPLFLALLFPASLSAQQTAYSLMGQLIFDNETPVARAEVSVLDTDWKEAADPVLTDARGRFAFAGLPEGTFLLTARRNDLGTFTWGESPHRDNVRAQSLGPKFPSAKISFRIERPGTIVGTLRDAAGNLVAHRQLTAVRRSWANGKVIMEMNGSAATDDNGRFRLPLLHPGRYRVCAEGSREPSVLPVGYAAYGQNTQASDTRSCVPQSGSREAFVLSPGAKVEVDIVLSQRMPVEVSGRVVKLEDQQQSFVELEAADSSEDRSRVGVQTSGITHEFKFPNVMPGRYWLNAQIVPNAPDRKVFAARVPITVGEAGLSGVELSLAPPPVIDVVVHAPKAAGEITVGLRNADQWPNEITNAERQADGSLRIALPYAGRYWLVTRTAFCPSAAHFGKTNAFNAALTIPPGANGTLDVTITDQCGEIQGVAVDSAGKPVPNSRNLILMSGTPEDPGDLFLSTAEDDGSFSYAGLAPGTYSLWAWSDASEWNGELEDLSKLRPRQTLVEVKAGEKQIVKVPLLNPSMAGRK